MNAKRGQHLNTQLDRYSHTTHVVLMKAQRSHAAPKWTAYTAAVGAALTIAPAIEAAPVYSGLQEIENMYGISNFPLDLDRDGFPDFFVYIYSEFRSSTAFGSLGAYAGSILVDGGDLRRLAAGDTISSMAGTFGGGAAIFSNGLPAGQWLPSQTGFAGVRFQRSGGEHFGWIRLHWGPNDEFFPEMKVTVKDWAYESVPGAPIEAGAGLPTVPEPSSLALLATGAAGVLAWRRRRRVRDSS
jgi:hypothetical protein